MFYNIALSGGGVNTISFIGCHRFLEESYMDDGIKNYIGASAGAIMCLLMIIGFSSVEIEKHVKDVLVYPKGLQFSLSNFMKIFKTYGINSGDHITEVIQNMLEKKNFDKNCTFLDISKRTGKNIIIAVANISQGKIEYISVDNYPEMKITTAIRMSTCIPVLYEPVKYYDDLYVDSFVYNNFPIIFFDKYKIETLGLNVYSKKKKGIKSFLEYLELIFSCVKKTMDIFNKTEHPYVCNIPAFENKSQKMFDIYKMKFSLTDDFIESSIKVGYEHLKVFIQESK